ncbi:tyrosinase family oxidase copper chaperone [Streptomyces sp. NPDC006339]|uniref:tyrosinase family oxidase copper chaperone n=1 Tax=Streptomyces sp. NPDC006339 TaxID=3156755 RepID=UPI0033A86ACF
MIVPRRAALRSLFALAVTAFTGGALARIAGTPPSGREPVDPAAFDPAAFDEMYAGRHIQGRTGPSGAPVVLVDGRPLHLMRCADGGYVSPLDHYESCPTPLAATRAAVDAAGPAPLTRYAAVHGAHPGGSPRGVHA